MSIRMRSFTGALLLAALGPACALAQGTYRWVDEKGVVHYGDRVPPQYVEKESVILNKQGVPVGKLDAQKTPAELAEEARLHQMAMRQKQHDAFLLTTYASIADIERLRDERLATIATQRSAAEQYIESLNSRLSSLQERALKFKPYNAGPEARRMPDALAQDLVRTLNEMRSQRGGLEKKAEEEAALRKQFQADIERYKELRVARVPR